MEHVSSCVEARGGHLVPYSVTSLLLRQGCSLNLELGWQSAGPKDLLISTCHSPRVAGMHMASPDFVGVLEI